MMTGIYAALAALLVVGLARNVIRLRRQYQVALGDGGNEDLLAAIRAHANAVEYLPIGLLLLLIFELNRGPIWLLHILCGLFIVGRLIHAYGVSKAIIRYRILGMQITIWLLIIMAVLNLFAFAVSQLAN